MKIRAKEMAIKKYKRTHGCTCDNQKTSKPCTYPHLGIQRKKQKVTA